MPRAKMQVTLLKPGADKLLSWFCCSICPKETPTRRNQESLLTKKDWDGRSQSPPWLSICQDAVAGRCLLMQHSWVFTTQ